MNIKSSQQPSPIINKEDFLRNVADAVPALIAVYSIRTGEYIYANNSVKKILGYSPEEFIKGGLTFATSIVHPDDLPRIMEENEKVIALANSKKHGPDMEPIANFEYRMKHKKGHWVWLHTDGSIYSRGKDGKVEYILNVSVDITRRKEAEEKLKKFAAEKITYEKILINNIADAVIVTDTDYNVISWNKGAEEMYGWKAEEVLRKPAGLLLQTAFVGGVNNDWIDSLKKDGKWNGEVVQKRKDGTDIPILASVASVKNDNGEVIGNVAVNRDITHRKEEEKMKDDFIALASHEMKTPVTSLKIFTQVLQQRLEKKGEMEFVPQLKSMDKQLTKLVNLVNDLLDASRARKEKLDYIKEAFSIDELIRETVENTQRISETHTIIIDEEAKCVVSADRDRVEQVLINLISNAIKYSPEADKILIGATAGKEFITVHVKDFGLGIPKNEQSHIFGRFYQVNNPTVKTYPGLGLGLYISAQIVERHHGAMWVESEEGKGSTFYFTLPIS
jgi:PAS domain S-box-containing protein